MTKTLIVAISLLGSISAFAGQGSSGGGDVIICKDFNNLLPWWKKTHLADTYSFFQNGGENVLSLIDENQAYSTAIKTLEAKEPGLGLVIDNTVKKLDFVPVSKLEELDDDNINLDVPGCYKKQLAIQNLELNEVRVNEKFYNKLSPAEKALFKIHEAFINIRNAPSDTTPIRAAVRAIVESKDFTSFLNHIVIKFSKEEVLERTKLMLKKLCYMDKVPTNYDTIDYLAGYRSSCANGQGTAKLVNRHFADLHLHTYNSELEQLSGETVAEYSDYIWSKIPKLFKKN